tara:strand:+ start:395 stop:568 length:174 start_codon:yes stop_codon:yes gene_type:complete
MTKAKVYGIRSRRQGALDRLITEKNTYEENEAKVPKRINREIERLEHKIKNFSRKNK